MDERRTNLHRPGRLPLILLAAAGAAAGAYGVLWLREGTARPPASAAASPDPAVAPDAPAEAPAEATAPAPAPRVEAPVPAAGARELLEGVSESGLLRRWLRGARLVRRCAIVGVDLAEGVSPRRQLGALGPSSPFSVARSGGGFVISPDSYARYDAVTEAIASIDARALAAAYRRLHAALEAALRALGYPGASLDRVAARALRRIEDAPVADAAVRVERSGGAWVMSDPALERLGDVEKHLLRMGPRNARLLRAKAREIRQALRLPETVAAGAR